MIHALRQHTCFEQQQRAQSLPRAEGGFNWKSNMCTKNRITSDFCGLATSRVSATVKMTQKEAY
jgi:hypothetical protein